MAELVDTPSLREFILTAKTVSNVEELPAVPVLKAKTGALKGICAKKLHELSSVCAFLEPLEFNTMLEIGGGKGNLSYLLCLKKNISAVSVDMDKEFQKAGAARN